MKDPERILIVRLSALGDIVMSSGLITALHARYPQAQISWLCEGAGVPLLEHNPRLHGLIVWPRARWQALWDERRWGELWRAVRAFRAQLRAQRFDLVLDGQGLLKSGLCAWMTGAPRRIGILSREGSRWLMHERLAPPPGSDPRIGSEYRYLARHLGASDGDYRLDLALGAAARERALASLQQAGACGPLVMLCPFTTRPQKHWVEGYWAPLAAALRAQGLCPVMLGGPGDADAAQRICSAAPDVINLVGRLRLDETVAAIADARLLIGVDTGLTHMGTALGVPTVALFGSTRPYLQSGTPTTKVMYDALPCAPCRRHPTCDGRFDCMRLLTVERVLESAMPLYRRGEGSSAP